MTTKRTNLATALKKEAGKSISSPPTAKPLPAPSPSLSNRPQSRQGKKAITGHFDPLVSRQLKEIALAHDSTVQALVAEALNDLFEKYDRKPIA